MWEQWWVVQAPDASQAEDRVTQALPLWTPDPEPPGAVVTVRAYRGPDDTALANQIAQGLANIRQTVAQSHREELSRRLQRLRERPRGIPPQSGWVILDQDVPRSPRPTDMRTPPRPRWVVTVRWPGDPPALDPDG